MKLRFLWLWLSAVTIACAGAALAASFFIAPLEPAPVRVGAAPPAQTIALRPRPGSQPSSFSVTRIAR